MRLEGRVAVITGGASGIGAETVRLFAREGARVVAGDIQDELGEKLAAELGESVRYVHADVTREADVRALVESATEEFGRLDCLFNNAGAGGARGELHEISVEDFDATVALLLRSVFLGIKHAIPIMKEQGSGSIINTASVAGVQAGFGPHVYSACKAAVIHVSRTTALDLGEAGIRVNAICPGGILTPLLVNAAAEILPDPSAAREVMEAGLKVAQPIKRAGLPEDIARTALWLASDESSFVTGQAIVVDGGLTSGRKALRGPASPDS